MLIPSKKSGYTLLFAVLVATLVLGVAVFITGIARKQYILSSTALDSLYALYAADSGIQCATANWDPTIKPPRPTLVNCNSLSSYEPVYTIYTTNSYGSYLDRDSSDPVQESSFSLGFYTQTGSLSPVGCAVIKIDAYKMNSAIDPPNLWHTIILSKGYNLCKLKSGGGYEPDGSSPRTVERALQLDYYQ